jgi:hypothetical protein
MKYNYFYYSLLLGVLMMVLFTQSFTAQSDTFQIGSRNFHREYTFIYGLNNDVLNSSENIKTGLKIYSDIYYRLLAPTIKNKTIRGGTGFVWSFVGKWSSILWPHEFGHMLRTKQQGGQFSFVKLQFPGVIGNLQMPENATTEQHTLALVGGFEANYLSARDIQFDFFRCNGLYNDELGMAFGSRIMYPLYAYVFSRQNPKDPETWNFEGGDPVNFAKLVWENGNRDVFNSDGSVNNKLVNFYNNAGLISILWNLMDINFYKQVGAFFGNELKGNRPYFVEGENLEWSYGTLFNTSVLGAELYFNNYLKLGSRFFNVYFKYGFPYRNIGLGLTLPDILIYKRISVLGHVDLWSQDYYGNGVSLSSTARYNVDDRLSILAQVGYKSYGYVVGRTTEKGGVGFLGLTYDLNK